MTEKQYRYKVKKLVDLARGDISYTDIARITGQSPQNLYKKLVNGSIRTWEFLEILEAVGKDITIRSR